MIYKRFSVYLLLVLAACSSAQESTKQTLDTVGDETSSSWNKMRDLLDLGPAKKEVKEDAQPRYCYRTFGDVICYPTPIAGEEYRLTGYQTSSGKTGYILPAHGSASPESTVKEPSVAKESSVIKEPPPPPALKSVTVNAPPKIAGTSTPAAGEAPKQLKEVIFDPSELEPKQLVPNAE